jgi:hypothetical protein
MRVGAVLILLKKANAKTESAQAALIHQQTIQILVTSDASLIWIAQHQQDIIHYVRGETGSIPITMVRMTLVLLRDLMTVT